ncbi:MAG: ShlB/FhaC/HecB family hemolysin secretion/activation protein [Psychrobium sp.]
MRFLLTFTFLFLTFTVNKLVCALPVDEDAVTKRIKKQQQLKREQRQRERDARRSINTPIETPKLKQESNLASGGHCFEISTIKLDGATLLSDEEKAELFKGFIGECLGLKQINALLKRVTAHYMQRGYITTRAYLSQQNLSLGTLTIIVQEGELTAFGWGGESGLSDRQLWLTMPITSGSKLNLRDVEQGLDQLNRLQSNSVKTEMIPGDQQGQTQILLKNNLAKRWAGSVSYDNSGQKNTGKYQQGVNLSGDNILGLADFLSVNYQSDTSSKKLDESSVSHSIHYDIPYGYWNFDFDLSYFRYHSQYTSGPTTFVSHGRTRSQSIRTSYLFHRDQGSKNGVRFTLSRNQSQNYIQDVILDSSKKTASAKLEVYREQFIENGRWQLSGSFHKGLRLFGALADEEQLPNSPRAEFEKTNVNFNYSKQFSVFEIPLNWDADLRTQYSSDILFGGQQFSLGGLYTIRGYKENGLFGNSGALLRQQLSYNLQDYNPFGSFKHLGQWKLFVAYDIGRVKNKEPTSKSFHGLSGWALGFSSGGGIWSWSMTYAQPLDKPNGISPKSNQFDFTLSANF